MGDAKSDLAELLPQRLACDSQDAGRLMLVAASELQDQGEQDAVELLVHLAVQVVGSRLELLPNECLKRETVLGHDFSPGRLASVFGEWPIKVSGRNEGIKTLPVACNRACLRTLCSSRILPGQA